MKILIKVLNWQKRNVMGNNIRRTVLLSIVAIFSTFVSFAQQDTQNENFERGMEAFKEKDFEKAISYLSPFESSLSELDDDSKCTFIFILGICYREVGNIEKSISLYEKINKLSSHGSQINSQVSLSIKPALLTMYRELANSDKANEYANEILTLLNKPEFQKSGYYSDYAVALCTYYTENNQFGKVPAIANKCLNIIDSEEMSVQLRGIQKCNLYTVLGHANYQLQNYELAIKDYKNALAYISYTQQEKADLLSYIGQCFGYVFSNDSALVYFREAERLYVRNSVPQSRNRVINSMNLGVELANIGKNKEAQQFLLAAERGLEQIDDKELLQYVYSHLYNNSKVIGDNEQVKKYANLVKKYIEYTKKDNSRIYRICYSTYASILVSEGRYQEAIPIMNDIAKTASTDIDCNNLELSSTYYKIASWAMDNGEYLKAEEATNKSLELLEPIKEKVKDQYVKTNVLMAWILSKTNRVGVAVNKLESLKEFVEGMQNEETTIADYYDALSGIYALLGNYQQILKYGILSSDVQLKNKGPKSYAYAVSLINLSEGYALNQQEEKSKECLDSAANIIKDLYGETSREYYEVLKKATLKNTHDSLNIDKGEYAFSKFLELSNKLYGSSSVQYAEALCWYGLFRLYSSRDREGVTILNNGIDILASSNGNEHILFFLSQLSTWLHLFKDYESEYIVDKKYYNMAKQYLSDNLPKLVEWQREGLWTKIQENLSHLIAAAPETNSSQYLKLAYNILLLGKGLLLQCNNNITSAIRKSNDIELIDIHKQIQAEKSKLLSSTDKDTIMRTREAINAYQRKELHKLSQLKVFHDIFNIEWTDVCENLEDGDVAIEFVSYPTQDCNSYVALVLNHKSRAPLCIPLFNDKELEKYALGDIGYDYQNPDLYRVVWDRLENYALRDAKRVFFSPDGLLHKMAIENLIDKNGLYASEKWNLYRLSSTREIVNGKDGSTYKSAVLYGGLQYSMEATELAKIVKHRSGFSNNIKVGTKAEVDDIQKTLKQHHIISHVFEDVYGTEESFKSLSGTGLNILHLATHGYFWTAEQRQKYKNLQFYNLMNQTTSRESALLSSGLVLSGANVALRSSRPLENIEDGLLTAQEISTLDFDGLDLVVLSACETALGEITSDGVFGLQRGFKLSGAQSIVMSLWKVADTPTTLLMTEFYRQLLQGESKCIALRNAQRYVRIYENGIYSNPKYWAAFIILDAI